MKTSPTDNQATMPFLAHLAELRTRLIRAALALGCGTLAAFFVAEPIYAWLAQPLLDALPAEARTLHFLNPVEPFLVYLKVAVLVGAFAASPLILYQLWRFIAPGLYPRERKVVIPFVTFGTLFFVGGGAFCHYVVLPVGLETLMNVGFTSNYLPLEAQITMAEYFSLATKLILAFGIAFELPVVVLFLSWVGLIDHRTLLRHWRGALVGAFVIAAILTPPDVATQLMLAGPLMILYALSVGIAFVFSRRTKTAAK